MKKKILIMLIGLINHALPAQILHSVKWSYAAKRISKDEAVLFIKATIDDGWHIYSISQQDGGPRKTIFKFTPLPAYSLLGNTEKPKPVTRFEKAFSMDVNYFEHSVVFQQKIKLRSVHPTVKGSVGFMGCNDQKC